jgi:hypothetical protein
MNLHFKIEKNVTSLKVRTRMTCEARYGNAVVPSA